MKCCVLTDVGTWTYWLTFEPDPDYSSNAETGSLSLRSYTYWPLQQGLVLQWFYGPPLLWRVVLFTEPVSCWNTNTFVRGTCAPPSVLLVCFSLDIHTYMSYNIIICVVLSVYSCVYYVLVLVFKALHGLAPQCLTDDCHLCFRCRPPSTTIVWCRHV